MGEAVARLLLKAGHELLVLKNRNPELVHRPASEGAAVVSIGTFY